MLLPMVLLDYCGIEMKRAFKRVTLASVCVVRKLEEMFQDHRWCTDLFCAWS